MVQRSFQQLLANIREGLVDVLLSFAQFERAVIGERNRDKVAFSSARGSWWVGAPRMEYRVRERRLTVKPPRQNGLYVPLRKCGRTSDSDYDNPIFPKTCPRLPPNYERGSAAFVRRGSGRIFEELAKLARKRPLMMSLLSRID